MAICTLIFKGHSIENQSSYDSILLSLVRSVLSGPFSSRLMKRLRDKEGLLYDISCGSTAYKQFGVNSVAYDIEPKLFSKTLEIVLQELYDFYTAGVNTKELEHFKEYRIKKFLHLSKEMTTLDR